MNDKKYLKKNKVINYIKRYSTSVPRTLNNNNSSITNPVAITNIFNNQFAFVAEKTRTNVNYSQTHFSEYMV